MHYIFRISGRNCFNRFDLVRNLDDQKFLSSDNDETDGRKAKASEIFDSRGWHADLSVGLENVFLQLRFFV